MKEGGATEEGRSAQEGAVDTVEDQVGDGQFQRRNRRLSLPRTVPEQCPLWRLSLQAMGSTGCARGEPGWPQQDVAMAGTGHEWIS